MVASNDKMLDDNFMNFNNLKLLKSAAIYGANASGKTNILMALSYITQLILNSHKSRSGETLEFRPFRLDKKIENSKSTFEIVFEIGGVKYIYGISLDKNKVNKEHLYYYPHGRKKMIFNRDIDNPNIYTFPAAEETRQNVIKENTPENMLYLSRSANMNYEKTSIVVKWFSEKIKTIFMDSYVLGLDAYTKKICAENEGIKINIIKDFISKADSGIVDLAIKEKELGDDFLQGIPKEIRDIIVEEESRTAETVHLGLDKEGNEIKIAFDLEEESRGTRKMFSLAGPFIDVLSNGRLLLIDEFERSLHPILVRYLIEIFNSPKYNKNGAQLIFTTHDTYLLHPHILRRDQVWFTEKKGDQSTDLRSLYEYKARKDENIEKGYLAGRYGAIPNLD
jgi:AAA15 family ATPase/GTPase